MNFYNKLIDLVSANNQIPQELFEQVGIARGMRKPDGKGILVGMTSICENFGVREGRECLGQIQYRGIDLCRIVDEMMNGKHHTYEEVAFLLLFGQWPDNELFSCFLDEKIKIHSEIKQQLEKIILKESGNNLMNIMARCVLNLYDFDIAADKSDIGNIIRQVITLLGLMPVISVNAYRRKRIGEEEAFSLCTDPNLTIAENILYMLRDGGTYTSLEVEILNICLILHAELGGGNNSTFTTQVVASTGTDTYSIIASAICSIKGPKHGGANIKAFKMLQDLKNKIINWEDEIAIENYLYGIMRKEEFDSSGLIYGVGHAVFTISDPRTKILKEMARKLSEEKGREAEFYLYERVEKIAPKVISAYKNVQKTICANVDFYSGFIYDMLGIPTELFTPMFVNARIAGWGAHRIEEMCNNPRIIHPAFQCVTHK